MALVAYITPHLDINVYGYWLIVETTGSEEEASEELACNFFESVDKAEEFCLKNFGLVPEIFDK